MRLASGVAAMDRPRKKKVLLVGEADPLVAEGTSLLDQAQVEVFVARTVEDALDRHRAEHVCLIVVDLDLADDGAVRLCRAVRRDEELRKVSLLLLGGEADDRRVEACRASARVPKPLDQAEFLSLVARLVAIPERKSYRVLLQVRVDGELGPHTFFCMSHNLSVAGLLIETDHALAVGEVVHCSFFLPGGTRIVADAEVVRARPAAAGHQYGMRFLRLTQAQQVALSTFVEQARLREVGGAPARTHRAEG